RAELRGYEKFLKRGKLNPMKSILSLLLIILTTFAFASCAQMTRAEKPVSKAMPAGSHFDDVGRVTMHAGQPCTPQIMFDFRGSKHTVSLAARINESKTLTDAAKKHRRVHISGRWQRGREKGCSYVEVTNVQ